ncbi:LOW QUALITY PROTEIN: centrosomal protein 20 [Ctenodactylus gundi]
MAVTRAVAVMWPLHKATVAKLKAVLKDTLEKGIAVTQARIAQVFNALNADHEPQASVSHENFLINELIWKYLEFNKFKYMASVLTAEFGQSVLPRQFLIADLSAFEESKDNTTFLLYPRGTGDLVQGQAEGRRATRRRRDRRSWSESAFPPPSLAGGPSFQVRVYGE